MKECIGTCSICGGRVMQHTAFFMVLRTPIPPARCESCGAVEVEKERPVIRMRPGTRWKREESDDVIRGVKL